MVPPQGRRRSRASRSARRTIVALLAGCGWLVIAVALAALVAERTGFLGTWLRAELHARLGDDAPELALGSVRLDWLRRTLVIEDLALGPAGRDLYAKELELLVDWQPGRGPVLRSAVLRGGHLRLSSALQEAIGGWRADADERAASVPLDVRDARLLPLLAVEDLIVSLEDGEGRTLPLGRMDAVLRPAGGRPRLEGRLWPGGVQRSADTPPVWLAGELDDAGVLRVRGSARGLRLTEENFLEGTPLWSLRPLRPRAVLDLEATARYELGVSVLPRVEAQLDLREGTLVLPHLTHSERRPVDPLRASLVLSYDGSGPDDLWSRHAWEVQGHLEAEWEGVPGTVSLRVGRAAPDDLLADAWLHLPRASYGDGIAELLADEPTVVEIGELLQPKGHGDVAVGLRFPADWKPGRSAGTRVGRAIVVRAAGTVSVSYVGEKNRREGSVRNLGFPLPVSEAHGSVIYAYEPGLELPEQLAFFDLRGRHASGPVSVSGSMWTMPRWALPGFDRANPEALPFRREMSLRIGGQQVAVDQELQRALEGLSGVEGTAELFPTYGPSGGHLDFRLELDQPLDQVSPSLRLLLEMDRVGFTWDPFPVPLEEARGWVALVTDGAEAEDVRSAVVLELEGRSAVSDLPLRVEGRVEGSGPRQERSWVQVQVQRVNLRAAALRTALGHALPEALESLERTSAAGFVDLSASAVQAGPDAPLITTLEATTRGEGIQGRPEAFPMDTRGVQGRMVAVAPSPESPDQPPPPGRVRADLEGRWLGGAAGVPVAFRFVGEPDQPLVVEGTLTGLDLGNPTVLGALRALMQYEDPELRDDPQVELELAGHLDASARIEMGEGQDDPARPTEITAELALEHLALAGVELLRDARGRVTYDPTIEGWRCAALDGLLVETPVALRDLTLTQGAQGQRLEAQVRAEGLPLDETHLAPFVDAATRRTLLEDLGARGRVDVREGTLVVESRGDAPPFVAFDGNARLRDGACDLGVPVKVQVVERADVHLRVEQGRLRGWGQLQGFFGSVAGRAVDRASMVLSYVDPSLSIDEFRGTFEGGELRSPGTEVVGGGGLLSLSLVPPYDFSFAGELVEVDVGRLTAGAFNSDFANEGWLTGDLRLSGDLEHLTAIEGTGRASLRDSSLWAIPVFQTLFAQLGFDSTAVFSEMSSAFVLHDGVIRMEAMRMRSDLLSLVGAGSLSLEGDLHHDLEVRYSLVDRLGPFTRLLYWIQNSLLRVSIRGDMSRPVVELRGFFSQFFASDDGRRHLPLPGLSELPDDF